MSELSLLYSDVNCTLSQAFLSSRWVHLMAILYPAFALSCIIGNCLLIQELWPKRFNHPLSNLLLLNNAVSSGLFGVTVLGNTVWRVWRPMFQADPCGTQDTVFGCNVSYGLLFVLVSVADMSRIVLIVERAVLSVQSYRLTERLIRLAEDRDKQRQTVNMMRPATEVWRPSPPLPPGGGSSQRKLSSRAADLLRRPSVRTTSARRARNFNRDEYYSEVCALQRDSPTTVAGGPGAACLGTHRRFVRAVGVNIGIWVFALTLELARITNLRDPHLRLAFCTARNGNMIAVLIISIFLWTITFALICLTHVLSRKQLLIFSSSQVHFTLTERVTLRYNLHLSKTLAPVMIYSLVCQLFSCTIFILNILNGRFDWGLMAVDLLSRHFLTLYLYLFFNFTPAIVFGFYCYLCFKRLKEHGPSLVINSTAILSSVTRRLPSTKSATVHDADSSKKIHQQSQQSMKNSGPSRYAFARGHVLNQASETHFNTLVNMWNGQNGT